VGDDENGIAGFEIGQFGRGDFAIDNLFQGQGVGEVDFNLGIIWESDGGNSFIDTVRSADVVIAMDFSSDLLGSHVPILGINGANGRNVVAGFYIFKFDFSAAAGFEPIETGGVVSDDFFVALGGADYMGGSGG